MIFRAGINETEITHLITSQELLAKVIKLLPQLPSVTHVIYMESKLEKDKPILPNGVHFIVFSQLETLGLKADQELRGM